MNYTHLEAADHLARLAQLYPKWNPTGAQREALGVQLTRFAAADVRAAMDETYAPGKRVAPMEAILAACRRRTAEKKKAVERAAAAAVERAAVVTDAEAKANYQRMAAKGSAFAIAMCKKLEIEVPACEVPF
jgi:hypothetical protein